MKKITVFDFLQRRCDKSGKFINWASFLAKINESQERNLSLEISLKKNKNWVKIQIKLNSILLLPAGTIINSSN